MLFSTSRNPIILHISNPNELSETLFWDRNLISTSQRDNQPSLGTNRNTPIPDAWADLFIGLRSKGYLLQQTWFAPLVAGCVVSWVDVAIGIYVSDGRYYLFKMSDFE